MELEKYLKDCKFDKYFKKLIKKLEGKTVIIYGAGKLLQLIMEKYDLSNINIIGISDFKYYPQEEGNKDLGYSIIPLDCLEKYPVDCLLLGLKKYWTVQNDFKDRYKDKATKIIPLVKAPFLTILKDFFID